MIDARGQCACACGPVTVCCKTVQTGRATHSLASHQQLRSQTFASRRSFRTADLLAVFVCTSSRTTGERSVLHRVTVPVLWVTVSSFVMLNNNMFLRSTCICIQRKDRGS